MIDFHSHFLPGMDDGSESPEETVQMLRLSWQQGVDTIVATPHFYALQDNPERFLERRQASWDLVAYDAQMMPKVLLGAEVTYFSGMSHSEDLDKLCIDGTRILLVEMPLRPWSRHEIEDLCDLCRQGFVPVVAHINRYMKNGQIPAYGEKLLAEGVLFQANADFFLEMGKGRALRMLKNGQIHFLGSDSHNMQRRISKMDQAVSVIQAKLGQEPLEQMAGLAEALLGKAL